ncbi:hypothetical protein VPHD480_0258 [Vibrio phage D480]|nr:hypothetical protein MYOV011v1_p0368 [Vibrio phage 6E35.1a]
MNFFKKIRALFAAPALPEVGSLWIHNPQQLKYSKELDLAIVTNVSEVNQTVEFTWYRLDGRLVTQGIMQSSRLTIPVRAFYQQLSEEYNDFD